MPLILDTPVLRWAAGARRTVRLSPLTLPAGRTLSDFSGYTLTIRADPLFPRDGSALAAAAAADPRGDGWAVAATVAGAVVAGVVQFEATAPADAGERRYALDVWAALAAGGETELVPATWLTVGARVKA